MTIDVAPAASEIAVSGAARHVHDGWVSEFEAFQSSGVNCTTGGGMPNAVPMSARSGRSGRSVAERRKGHAVGGNPVGPMDNLKAEIKLLHWHKLANEAALKAALLKTKRIKAQGGGITRPVPAMTTLAMPHGERAAWMQQVIEEEQSKPLQVTKHFMSTYEEQEKENEGRLDNEVAAHIRSLRNLRQQIEKRGEMKARRAHYKVAQKQLEIEKEQLLRGKLDDAKQSTELPASDRSGKRARAPAQVKQKSVGALDTVLGSLDKLVELEKRISSLEKSNVYDDFRAAKQGATESRTRALPPHATSRRTSGGTHQDSVSKTRSGVQRPGAGARGHRLSFSKQKSEATVESPSQVYYSVRVRRRLGSALGDTNLARKGRRRGDDVRIHQRSGAGAVNARAQRGPSTFLTQLPNVHRYTRAGMGRAGPEFCREEKRGTRSAVAEKKRLEAKRRIAGQRAEAMRVARQDRIIREWMQRKRAAAVIENRQRTSSHLSGPRGTAAGVRVRRSIGQGSASASVVRSGRNSNIHLREFRDIRAQYTKRTERLRRDLARKQRGPEAGAFWAGTRTSTATRPRPGPSMPALPSHPVRMSRQRPSLARKREVRRRAETIAWRRGGQEQDERGRRARRVSQGARLAVGGTGLRAARARQSQRDTRLPNVRGTRNRIGNGVSGPRWGSCS